MKTLFSEETRRGLWQAQGLQEMSGKHDPAKELAAVNALLREMPLLKRHWNTFHSVLMSKLDAVDDQQHGVGDVAERSDDLDQWRRHYGRKFPKADDGLDAIQELESILILHKKEVEREVRGR